MVVSDTKVLGVIFLIVLEDMLDGDKEVLENGDVDDAVTVDDVTLDAVAVFICVVEF